MTYVIRVFVVSKLPKSGIIIMVIPLLAVLSNHIKSCHSWQRNIWLVVVHPQFHKRDTLRDIELGIQQRWEREKVFEVDAPKVWQL